MQITTAFGADLSISSLSFLTPGSLRSFRLTSGEKKKKKVGEIRLAESAGSAATCRRGP